MTGLLQRERETRRPGVAAIPGGLLCVCNFPANTGYAWDFIEALYAGLSDRLAARGVVTWVAYPAVTDPPRTLMGSGARAVELEVRLDSRASMQQTVDFVREHRIRVVYLCDRPSWDPAYRALRRAGVERIIVHDHTSGERTAPTGLKRALKRLRMVIPGCAADDVLAVSDFVARRQVAVNLVPRSRVTRVWNSIVIPAPQPDAAQRLRRAFGLAAERPVIAAASRATAEKGIGTLLRAFDKLVVPASAGAVRPVLLYMGAGPELAALEALRAQLAARDDILLAGYVDGAADLIEGADVCVVPSQWDEAFGLAALEPMSRGVPVIASRVGGLPEIIEDGVTGRLVEPGNEVELAAALKELLEDPAERVRLGSNGRVRAAERFSREAQLTQLQHIVEAGFA